MQQGAPAATLAKQAEKASGVETVNAIKDNLDIEEAALAAKLAALDEDYVSDDDSDDDKEKETTNEDEKKEGEADAGVAGEEPAGEGEKKEGDGDAAIDPAAAPEEPAAATVEAEKEEI
jgi:hypothetical protein